MFYSYFKNHDFWVINTETCLLHGVNKSDFIRNIEHNNRNWRDYLEILNKELLKKALEAFSRFRFTVSQQLPTAHVCRCQASVLFSASASCRTQRVKTKTLLTSFTIVHPFQFGFSRVFFSLQVTTAALTGAVTMITKSAAAQHLLTRAVKRTEHVDSFEKEWEKKDSAHSISTQPRHFKCSGSAVWQPSLPSLSQRVGGREGSGLDEALCLIDSSALF